MEKLFILMLVVAVVASQKLDAKLLDAKLAAALTDSDNSGVIDDAEFTVYAAHVTTHIEPKMRARFTPPTGDIRICDFISVVEILVEKAMEAGAPEPYYTPDRTGAYFDENHDGAIQPHEFDNWYALSMKYNMEFLKRAMQQGDDTITKAEFLGVLSYMETLTFFG